MQGHSKRVARHLWVCRGGTCNMRGSQDQFCYVVKPTLQNVVLQEGINWKIA